MSGHGPLGPEAGFCDRQARPLAADDDQSNDHADALRNGCAQGSPGRAQAQSSHEENVQADVGRAGDGDEIHGAFRVAHAAEDGADDIIGGDAGNAQEADGEILRRPHHGLRRGGHDGHDGIYKPQQHQRQDHGQGQKDGRRAAHGVGGPLALLAAHGLGDGDGGTHGQPHQHDGDHVHDLAADGDGRRAGYALKLADDEQVGHAVQRLQKIRQQIGQGKQQDIPQNAAGGEVTFHRPRPSFYPWVRPRWPSQWRRISKTW